MTMRVPLSWLKEFVDITMSLEALAHRMIMAGLEVSRTETIGAEWQRDKLLVGEVLEVKPHPNADRLLLATVGYGQGAPQTVVTGAGNIRPGECGQKVALALEGARLLDGHSDIPTWQTLQRSTLRGIESAGMVCSEKELGLSDDHQGILLLDPDAPVGQPLQDVLGDIVLEVELTPNLARANCILGLAREIAALTGQPLRMGLANDALLAGVQAARTSYITVASADPQLCARYSAAFIDQVTIRPSPLWMQRRLRLSGMRPINNIVDITNYCMLETGQPLHAFDYDTLQIQQQGIVVRRARPGERLQTLDGVDRELTEAMLLITDDSGPLALAGIMGGGPSEVSATTRRVLLESANFNFVNIRHTSQALRLASEAGQRFGRGIDPELTLPALLRAARLMETLGDGTIHPEIADTYPAPPQPVTLQLSPQEVRRILGMDFSMTELTHMLSLLECRCTPHTSGSKPYLEVVVPSYRLDISIAADLIEEVARIHGYEAIPLTLMQDVLPPQRSQPVLEGVEKVRDLFVGCGLTEILSYSLTSLDSIVRSQVNGTPVTPEQFVRLANPISQERELLRQSLLPSLLETLRTNSRYRQRMALFEIGKVYMPQTQEDLPQESRHLAVALTGPVVPTSWHDTAEPPQFDWMHLKGIIDMLWQRLNVAPLRLTPTTHVSFHPTRVAALYCGETLVGSAGEVHPQVCEQFDLPQQPVALFEVDLDILLAHRQPRRYQRISRFPAVLEDLALVVDADLPAQTVEATIRAAGGELLRHIELFDLYQGEQIPAGKKSLAYALTFQADDRSLTEEEVRLLYQGIQQQAAAEIQAEMRR